MKKCICGICLGSDILALEGRGLGEGKVGEVKNPQRTELVLLSALVRALCSIIILAGLLLGGHSPVHGASEAPDCLIDQGPCTSTVAGRQVVFDISPKPVRFMKELAFTVTVDGRKTAPTVLLDLTMPGMYMGINQVILKRTADGPYSGKGIIPRCPSGKKLWRAEVSLPGGGKASYTFNVSR